ncbi:hypothetical protein D3C76_1160050 [compost metagenome]
MLQRGKYDGADALLLQHIQKPGFNRPVQHGIRGLMNQAGSPQLLQYLRRFPRILRLVVGQAHIQRFALADNPVKRGHGFLKRRIGIGTVMVKYIHIIQIHPL